MTVTKITQPDLSPSVASVTYEFEPELCTDEQRDGQWSYVATIPYTIEYSDDAMTVICNQKPEPYDDTALTTEDTLVDVTVLDDNPINVN